jgi:hypothetical protein
VLFFMEVQDIVQGHSSGCMFVFLHIQCYFCFQTKKEKIKSYIFTQSKYVHISFQ